MTSEDRDFEYLLNALEAAGNEEMPAAHGYGDKRTAVLAYVESLERTSRDALREVERLRAWVEDAGLDLPEAPTPTESGEACGGCSRRFPIIKHPDITLAWSLMEPTRGQAMQNHAQSLERLAERGGLSPQEAMAVIDGLSWREYEATGEDEGAALDRLEPLAAHCPSCSEPTAPAPSVPGDDARRLDYLESLACPPGFRWRVYESTTGRGWRLATTSRDGGRPSVREAIDEAMALDDLLAAERGKGVDHG